jgi:hypothetical protein
MEQMGFRSEGPPFNSHVREGVDQERFMRVEARGAGTWRRRTIGAAPIGALPLANPTPR